MPFLQLELLERKIDTFPEDFTDSILRNFQIPSLDITAAAPVLDNGIADDFWIWAVDPGYVSDVDSYPKRWWVSRIPTCSLSATHSQLLCCAA